MNEWKIEGTFDRPPEMRTIDRPAESIELCTASINYTTKRGNREVKQWFPVEATGKKAFELADAPLNLPVRITGSIERAAWKDKATDEWREKFFCRFQSIEYLAEQPAGDDEYPF